jgi:hypothetical protein
MRTRAAKRPMTRVRIIGSGGSKEVDAEMIGSWAVHRAIGIDGYIVSYVRDGHPMSGTALVQVAGCDRVTCVRLAELLDAAIGSEMFSPAKHRRIVLTEINRVCGIDSTCRHERTADMDCGPCDQAVV